MKYFEIRLLKNRLVIMMFIAILTVMSCEMGMLFGNCDFVSLLNGNLVDIHMIFH